MPRKATEINQKHLAELKRLVLEQLDFKLLRSVDCDKLAKVVSEQTNTYINGISFKRLYGFTKYPFNPAIQTLDILSQFVGYDNWYEFGLSFDDNQPISNSELDILLSFYDFDLINNIEFHDGGIQSMSRKIALRFREDVSTFKRAILLIAKKEHAQIFFIEHFPDYDNLCNYYYLLYEAYLKQNKSDSAQLFGNSMLFLKSFWILNELDCKKYILEINRIKIDKSLHPYLIGRYFACNLLIEFYYGDKNKVEQLYKAYLQLRSQLPKKGKHFLDFPASEYIISEALLQVNAYEKCVELIELAFKEFPLKMEFVRKGYYRQMQLFWLISKKKKDSNFQISSMLQKINPANFYFISQKYFSVIYYYALYIEKRDSADLQQGKKLSDEMENKYLLEVLLNECQRSRL
jgi:hypothetical protein